MTLVLPGSAQLVAGRRDVGRIALRVWLSVLGGLLAVVLLGSMWHGFVYWLASNTVVLGFVRCCCAPSPSGGRCCSSTRGGSARRSS